jgi:hypothetical protein
MLAAQVTPPSAVNAPTGRHFFTRAGPDLIGVITVLLPFIGYPRTLNALAATNEVAPG